MCNMKIKFFHIFNLMDSHLIFNKKALFPSKYQTEKRRTISNLIGNPTVLTFHKTSNSIGSSSPCDDVQLEQIKLEIKVRLKEQQKREEFLNNMLQLDNEPSNTEMYTETTRKTELKTSESMLNESGTYIFCFKKLFSKCFWC